MGAAYALVQGVSSYTQLVELPAAGPPATVFSWKNELPYFPAGASGPSESVAFTASEFASSSLRVVWSLGGAQDASLAVIDTFAGGVVRPNRTSRVIPLRRDVNIRRSTVTIAADVLDTRRGVATRRWFVSTPSGSLTSDCVALGRDLKPSSLRIEVTATAWAALAQVQ